MRRYETIYILRPNLSEEEISKIIESTSQIIRDENGTVIDLNKWGMKKLAYLIRKESQGYYIFCDYAGSPAAVSEIERKFRIDDSVLRYLTIKTSVAISDEQIEQAIGAVTARETAEQVTTEETEGATEKVAAEQVTTEKTEGATEKVAAEQVTTEETEGATEKVAAEQTKTADKNDDTLDTVKATEE